MANVSDVVSKGQNVKVKVLSITGKKVSLSMKVSFAAFSFYEFYVYHNGMIQPMR